MWCVSSMSKLHGKACCEVSNATLYKGVEVGRCPPGAPGVQSSIDAVLVGAGWCSQSLALDMAGLGLHAIGWQNPDRTILLLPVQKPLKADASCPGQNERQPGLAHATGADLSHLAA
jgi:hypothetical protein